MQGWNLVQFFVQAIGDTASVVALVALLAVTLFGLNTGLNEASKLYYNFAKSIIAKQWAKGLSILLVEIALQAMNEADCESPQKYGPVKLFVQPVLPPARNFETLWSWRTS